MKFYLFITYEILFIYYLSGVHSNVCGPAYAPWARVPMRKTTYKSTHNYILEMYCVRVLSDS
jgi:hypothetical protein